MVRPPPHHGPGGGRTDPAPVPPLPSGGPSRPRPRPGSSGGLSRPSPGSDSALAATSPARPRPGSANLHFEPRQTRGGFLSGPCWLKEKPGPQVPMPVRSSMLCTPISQKWPKNLPAPAGFTGNTARPDLQSRLLATTALYSAVHEYYSETAARSTHRCCCTPWALSAQFISGGLLQVCSVEALSSVVCEPKNLRTDTTDPQQAFSWVSSRRALLLHGGMVGNSPGNTIATVPCVSTCALNFGVHAEGAARTCVGREKPVHAMCVYQISGENGGEVTEGYGKNRLLPRLLNSCCS